MTKLNDARPYSIGMQLGGHGIGFGNDQVAHRESYIYYVRYSFIHTYINVRYSQTSKQTSICQCQCQTGISRAKNWVR